MITCYFQVIYRLFAPKYVYLWTIMLASRVFTVLSIFLLLSFMRNGMLKIEFSGFLRFGSAIYLHQNTAHCMSGLGCCVKRRLRQHNHFIWELHFDYYCFKINVQLFVSYMYADLSVMFMLVVFLRCGWLIIFFAADLKIAKRNIKGRIEMKTHFGCISYYLWILEIFQKKVVIFLKWASQLYFAFLYMRKIPDTSGEIVETCRRNHSGAKLYFSNARFKETSLLSCVSSKHFNTCLLTIDEQLHTYRNLSR